MRNDASEALTCYWSVSKTLNRPRKHHLKVVKRKICDELRFKKRKIIPAVPLGKGPVRSFKGRKCEGYFVHLAEDLRPSSLALSVADSTALMVAALTPPCSRV